MESIVKVCLLFKGGKKINDDDFGGGVLTFKFFPHFHASIAIQLRVFVRAPLSCDTKNFKRRYTHHFFIYAWRGEEDKIERFLEDFRCYLVQMLLVLGQRDGLTGCMFRKLMVSTTTP